MPIYTYICEDCGSKFEIFTQRQDNPNKPKCEKCGSRKVSKTFSTFATGTSSSSSSGNSCPTGTCPLS